MSAAQTATAFTPPPITDPLELAALHFLSKSHNGVKPQLVTAGDPPLDLLDAVYAMQTQATIMTLENRAAEFKFRKNERYIRGDIQHLIPEIDWTIPTVVFARGSIGWVRFFDAIQILNQIGQCAGARTFVCLDLINNHVNWVDPSERKKSVQNRATILDEAIAESIGWYDPVCSYDAADVQLLAEMTGFKVAAVTEKLNGLLAGVLYTEGHSERTTGRVPFKIPPDQVARMATGNKLAILSWEGKQQSRLSLVGVAAG